jgi:putative inorganic carbon (hco3(-)) transporter
MSLLSQKQPASGTARQTLTLIGLTIGVCVVYGVGLAYDVSPLLLAAVPIGLAVAVGALVRPVLAVPVLLGMTWGYISDIRLAYDMMGNITKLLIALLLGGVLLQRVTSGKKLVLNDSVNWWIVAYLFMVAAGLEYARHPERVMMRLDAIAKDLALYAVLVCTLTTPRAIRYSAWAMLAVGALLGTLTVYQELTETYDTTYGGLARMSVQQVAQDFDARPRATGTTTDPNTYGQQLIVLVPIGLWALVYGRSMRERLAGGYGTLVCLAGIGLSFSRGTFLAVALVLLLFVIHIRLNPRYLFVVVPLLGVLWWFAPPELKARFVSLEQLAPQEDGFYEESSYRGRSTNMLMGLYMFADHPVIGVGAMNNAMYFPEYIRENGSPVPDETRPVHSLYIEVAADHGVVGLLIFGGLLVLAYNRLRAGQRAFAAVGNRHMAELAVALQIGFVGYLATSLFLHGTYLRFFWLQLAIAVALAAVGRRAVARAEAQRAPSAALQSAGASPR